MRDDQTRTDVLGRLRSAAGHLNGVARMVEDDAYCIDVIQQVRAVQAALDKVTGIVLDDHLHHCVTEAIRGEDADARERVLKEIGDVFRARQRR